MVNSRAIRAGIVRGKVKELHKFFIDSIERGIWTFAVNKVSDKDNSAGREFSTSLCSYHS